LVDLEISDLTRNRLVAYPWKTREDCCSACRMSATETLGSGGLRP